MRIGILGTGHLAEFLIRGAGGRYDFVVSPRSAARAAALAASHGVGVAPDNQAVVDGCDLILVCLPAAEGVEILRGLRFRAPRNVRRSSLEGSWLRWRWRLHLHRHFDWHRRSCTRGTL